MFSYGGGEDSRWSGESGRQGVEAESRRGESEQGNGWTRWRWGSCRKLREGGEERGGLLRWLRTGVRAGREVTAITAVGDQVQNEDRSAHTQALVDTGIHLSPLCLWAHELFRGWQNQNGLVFPMDN